MIHELEGLHLPYWFSKTDEAEMERHNKDYYVLDDVERLFLKYFMISTKEGEGVFMSGKEIMRELEKHSRKTFDCHRVNSCGIVKKIRISTRLTRISLLLMRNLLHLLKSDAY